MTVRPRPERQTCETCDWWCYGTWPDNTCDQWEYTIAEIEVDDDILAAVTGQPTSAEIRALLDEAEGIG